MPTLLSNSASDRRTLLRRFNSDDSVEPPQCDAAHARRWMRFAQAMCLLVAVYFGGHALFRALSSHVATTPIEQIVVGQRVYVDPPASNVPDRSLGDEVDPATWRRISLALPKPTGGLIDIELLRPEGWLEMVDAAPGQSIELSLPEIGVEGLARVLAIGPCPEIEPGEGRVVTATFAHQVDHVLDLHVAGQSAPIGITPTHLVYSVDRGDFVPAGQLRVGERMQQRDGPISITAIHPRPGLHPVFNIEVHTDHVYHVTAAGILGSRKGVRNEWHCRL